MTRIGFIGFGKMAEALWSSFRHQADVDGASTYEVNPIRIAVATDLGMTISQSINDVISSSNITFLCVKPQILSTLGQYDAGDSIVISILAGKSIATVGKTIQSRKLVRVMPNTPCMVNQGMAAVAWSDGVNDTEKSLVRALLGANGRVEDVPEEWMDVVTGISGSGPAFLYRLAESAIAAAADCGMPPDVAIRLRMCPHPVAPRSLGWMYLIAAISLPDLPT
ncbi:hypothetical protein EB093_01830 [bacterium]|nr:hypothetical protein [bacterium]